MWPLNWKQSVTPLKPLTVLFELLNNSFVFRFYRLHKLHRNWRIFESKRISSCQQQIQHTATSISWLSGVETKGFLAFCAVLLVIRGRANWTNFFFKPLIPNLDLLVLWLILTIASVKTALHNDHWFCLPQTRCCKKPFPALIVFSQLARPWPTAREFISAWDWREKIRISLLINKIRIYWHTHVCCFTNICKYTSFFLIFLNTRLPAASLPFYPVVNELAANLTNKYF